MSKRIKKKICIVTISLGGGGAERSVGLLSKILYSLGHEVHIVTAVNDIQYPFEGKLLNLGILKEKHSKIIGSFKRVIKLYFYLKKNDFDFVIDSRVKNNFLQEIFVSKLLYNCNKTIYCVRSFETSKYIFPNRILSKWLYRDAHKIVCVSNDIKKKLKNEFGFNNLCVINNPVEIKENPINYNDKNSEKYILFFGRLVDKTKNISLLLEAFSKSRLSKSGVRLKILGNGEDKLKLVEKAKKMACAEYIDFIEFTPSPEALIARARFTVLTSRYEGFPRMILESLALGTPVISVDCKSGPSELIINCENGLLVENYNADTLSIAMESFIFDDSLYKKCKANASLSVAKYNMENVGKKWQEILE